MTPRRTNPVVVRQADGTFRMVLSRANRDALIGLLGELEELLVEAPDDPSLRRLHPTAYSEDPERDAAYQLLAGEELRSNRQATIDAVRRSLTTEQLGEDELWSWLQALNALRLVAGTRLGIVDDDDRAHRRVDPDDPHAGLWEIYDFATDVQYFVILALRS